MYTKEEDSALPIIFHLAQYAPEALGKADLEAVDVEDPEVRSYVSSSFLTRAAHHVGG